MSDLQAAALQAVLCLAPTDGGRSNRQYLPLVREAVLAYATCLHLHFSFSSLLLLLLLLFVFVVQLLRELGMFASYACSPPPVPVGVTATLRPGACMALALASLDHMTRLFARYCDVPELVSERVAEELVQMLQVKKNERRRRGGEVST